MCFCEISAKKGENMETQIKDCILHYMPSQEVLENLANYFQAYSDKTRIKILTALSMAELCVSEISTLLSINQTTVSHQLKLLKSLSMVKYKRDGKIVYYSLANDKVNEIMMNGVEHIQGNKYIINN